jgi:hypothetical protein
MITESFGNLQSSGSEVWLSSGSKAFWPRGARGLTFTLASACSSIFGIVFLLPILFTAGDIGAALLSESVQPPIDAPKARLTVSRLTGPTGQPLPALYLQATGGNAAAFGLFFIVLLNGVACGLACSQVSSRCTWA